MKRSIHCKSTYSFICLMILAAMSALIIPSCSTCQDKEGKDDDLIQCDGSILKDEEEGGSSITSIQEPERVTVVVTMGGSETGYKVHRTEVSNAQYASFLKSRSSKAEESRDGESNDCNDTSGAEGLCYFFTGNDENFDAKINDEDYEVESGFENHPVNYVSFYGASRYCSSIGMVLPSADEWELIANEGASKPYPWGEDTPTCGHANAMLKDSSSAASTDTSTTVTSGTRESCETVTVTVSDGDFNAGESDAGLKHLMGNVAEWTQSDSGVNKITKGGHWKTTVDALQIDIEEATEPNTTKAFIGFRCLKQVDS